MKSDYLTAILSQKDIAFQILYETHFTSKYYPYCPVSTTFANPAIKANMLSDNVTEKRFQTSYNVEKTKEDTKMSVIKISKENYKNEVLNSDKPVLLDFYADWCGPCRMVGPIVSEIADERNDIKVGKINVDEQSELAAQFGVMSIPTLVVIKDGKIVNKAVGARPKDDILNML